MALGQSEDAIEQLEHADDPGRAVHETRKALKRLRALVRVLEGELGRKATARENAALAQTGRLLAEARDAEVLLATLDALIERHPAKLAGRKGVARLRRHLAQELMLARRRTIEDPLARARALGELRAFRERVLVWDLSDRRGLRSWSPVCSASTPRPRTVELPPDAQGRRRRVRCTCGATRRGPALHRRNARPAPQSRLRARASQPRRGPATRGTLPHARTRSPELLGDDHDLAVLAEWSGPTGAPPRAGRISCRTRGSLLLRLIARRRRELAGRRCATANASTGCGREVPAARARSSARSAERRVS